MQPVVHLHSVHRAFGRVRAVAGLDLDVHGGEIVGLLGHNGAGKSTTVRTIAGLLAPDEGTVRTFGRDPCVDGPSVRERIGVAAESAGLDGRLDAVATLRHWGALHGMDAATVARRSNVLLERFGLLDAAHERVGGYSKGMRQRLVLARAWLHDPPLFLMDEPTSGLDPVASKLVTDVLVDAARDGRTVLLCTHDLALAAQACDRVVILEHGRVVAHGAPATLAADLGASSEVLVTILDDGRGTDLLDEAGRLAGWSKVRAVPSPSGHAVQASVGDDEVLASGVTALVEAGARIVHVSRRAPSLEDVYFALHDRHDDHRGGDRDGDRDEAPA